MKKLLTILISLLILLSRNAVAQSSESITLLYDDFSNNNLANWNIRWGNWKIENGALVSEMSGLNKPGRIEIGSDQWRNYKIEVDIKNISGVDEGIGFKNNTTYNTNYELTLRHGTGANNTPQIGLSKVFWQDSSFQVLATYKPTSLVNNQLYHVTIEVIDSNIKVWIDQKLIMTYQDNDFRTKKGFINFSSWTGMIGYTKVQFDNVRVTSYDSYVQPFLDLPWDYEGKGLSFENAALKPFSWFDHKYPLQNLCPPCDPPVMKYTGETANKPYRSHNGYDYGSDVGVILNTPVLAAASGIATFKSWQNSGGAGNVIKIDHGNGYQTWYEHLSSDDLISSNSAEQKFVMQGEQIGKVGLTGNTDGPHIHFSVFKDSNYNGSFSDDYPFGVTDPLGWSGSEDDPWSKWSNGTRNGSSSFYLYINKPSPKVENIPPSGGNLATGSATITVAPGTSNTSFNLSYEVGPFESFSNIKSIQPSFFLKAFKNTGEILTSFSPPLTIAINYLPKDLFNINEDTLKIYFYNTISKFWEPLFSEVDKSQKKVTAQTSHLSHFALMGEIKDLTAPTSQTTLTGNKGADNWYRSDVEITLAAQDNPVDGVGLEYILYTLNDNDWYEYKNPIILNDEGDYKITYQSYDKAENQEQRKSLNFHIDKTPPTITGSFSPLPNSNGWNNTDATVHFECSDNLSGIDSCPEDTTLNTEGAGQAVLGTALDKAGNSASFTVTPINIDKTAPNINLNPNPNSIWPPNDKMVNVTIGGFTTDANSVNTIFTLIDEYGLIQPTITNFGQIIQLRASRYEEDKDGRTYTIEANATDLAGNISTASAQIIVPHDQRR